MNGNTERLNTALAGRYKIEKQLGQGGMATLTGPTIMTIMVM